MRSLPLLAFIAAVGCGGSTTRPAPIENRGGGSTSAVGVTDGALWTCQIEDYDPQPCKLTRSGDGWRLAKLLGSQRFRGDVVMADDRVDFTGEFFCPWGDCGQEMVVTFERAGAEQAYATTFAGGPITLRYDQANAEAYAGAGYGGLTGDEQ